tara:strand:+ start:4295 stop:6034 length:1740 start_codon:yes stop_codon:yes gene_type:complete
MSNLDILKRLYKNYTRKFLGKILLSVVFSIIVAGSTSSIAWLLDPAIKKIFVERDQDLMILITVGIICAFAFKGAALYFAKMLLIRVGNEITKIFQVQIMNSLIKADTKVIDSKHSGKFISNLTFDVNMIKNLVSTVILNLTKDTLTLIGLIGVMFYQNWRLTIFALIMIPLATIFAKSLGKRIGKATSIAADSTGILTSYILEIFKNHKIIKIFQKEDYEHKRSDDFINQLKEKLIKIESVVIRAAPIMETLTGIMVAGIILYAGTLISKDELEINNFFSFLAAMMLAYQPVRALATLNMGINQGLAAARRILPIIDLENEVADNYKNQKLKIDVGEIKFNNVNFHYNKNENQVLNDVNLTIEGGSMTSLVGHSGAGKSSILNLIPRFYDINKGNIKIDNQPINEVSIKSLRNNISLVNQDITLFDDTIKNNIAYANLEASHDDIVKAAELSFCLEFIEKLPEKFNTIIGENGFRLSGGEKQRLSIARAMLKKSKIILLDEATSSLDAETENKIQNALNLLTKNRTTLVIAHRLSTIMNSKKIYVIDSGKVAAEGDHSTLLKTSEIYNNFYKKQLRKD